MTTENVEYLNDSPSNFINFFSKEGNRPASIVNIKLTLNYSDTVSCIAFNFQSVAAAPAKKISVSD